MSMKKFTTLALAGLVASSVFGQSPEKQKFVASPEQMAKSVQNVKDMMYFYDETQPIVKAMLLNNQGPTITTNGKVSAVSPVTIGTAGNAFTCLRGEQTQVSVNNDLDMVTFTHRNNQTVFGGISGHLRYDVSIDNGSTFSSEIGVLNPTSSAFAARYPNGLIYNPAGNTNPLDAKVVYVAPTVNANAWDGHVNGVSSVSPGGSPTITEHESFQTTGTYLPGGLTEGLPGEFWAIDNEWDGAGFPGEINVYKGTYASGDVTWASAGQLVPNHYTGFDGTPSMVGPNLAASPDGSVLWIGWLGDLVGGPDSTYQPCFSKSTDNGATWSTPVAYNLNAEAWVADSLQSLWIDSLGNPASTGRATSTFDFDLTVDGNGNPHMAIVVASGSSSSTPDPSYSVYPGLAKFVADVYSTDGGATWDIAYISPVLTFRTITFGATASTVSMDNFPQICRSEDGGFVFFSWADSDTALVTGNANGIGFGESDNLAPNLRIAGRNVNTGEQSYPQLITDGDLIWEGRALYPTMGNVAVNGAANCWNLPIVILEMPGGEPVDPANFYYFGNDAEICASTMCEPASMSLSWDAFAFSGATPPCAVGVDNNVESNVVLGNAFPNPTADQSVITFELPAISNVSLDLVNVYGQQVAVLANGEFAAGAHRVVANTEKLASGVYFYNLRTNGQVISKKLVVSK
ncbi:MAG: hypothetical protein RLZZ519_3518 [Bacteroidota bacterium]